MRLPTQCAVLIGISAIAMLASQAIRTTPLPWTYPWSEHIEREALATGLALVDLDTVRDITETFSSVLIDARRAEDYHQGRLPGALSLPVYAFDEYMPMVLPMLLPEQPIVVYCSGADCDESILLGQLLQEQGFTNLSLFAGGYAEWIAHGHPVEQ